MSEYSFQLAKWSSRDKRLRCPQCGKMGYKVYVDQNGNDLDPEGHICGKCDHENSCGYHLPPKEFFRLNPDARQKMAEATPRDTRQVQRIEVDMPTVGRSMAHYDHNAFVCWLNTLPVSEERKAMIPVILMLYCVGTSKDGGTIWWQIDEDNTCRTGKKMLYDATGHRVKDEDGNSIGFNWVHAMMRQQGFFRDNDEVRYDLAQCLFGQHLIKAYPNADLQLVESEKTAIIMSVLDPDALTGNIWLACGGKQNIRQVLQAPVSGRRLIIYPDKDAFSGQHNWPDAVKELGIKCVISDAVLRACIEADGDKCDIADICLRRLNEQPEATLATMKKNNENVQLLIDRLNLTPE